MNIKKLKAGVGLADKISRKQMGSAQKRPILSQAQIDKMMKFLMLEPDDQKSSIYNSMQRIQGLMSLDPTYISKTEALQKKKQNLDLHFTSTDSLFKNQNGTPAGKERSEPEELCLISIPIVIKG